MLIVPTQYKSVKVLPDIINQHTQPIGDLLKAMGQSSPGAWECRIPSVGIISRQPIVENLMNEHLIVVIVSVLSFNPVHTQPVIQQLVSKSDDMCMSKSRNVVHNSEFSAIWFLDTNQFWERRPFH